MIVVGTRTVLTEVGPGVAAVGGRLPDGFGVVGGVVCAATAAAAATACVCCGPVSAAQPAARWPGALPGAWPPAALLTMDRNREILPAFPRSIPEVGAIAYWTVASG